MAEVSSHRSPQRVLGGIYIYIYILLGAPWVPFGSMVVLRAPPEPRQTRVAESPGYAAPLASWSFRDSIFDLVRLSCEKSKIPKKRYSRRWDVSPFFAPETAPTYRKRPKKALPGGKMPDLGAKKGETSHLRE